MEATMLTDKERDTMLIRMDEKIKEIHKALERDYKCLHGNGQPGLIQRVQQLENYHSNENSFIRRFGAVIAWIATTALALYSAIKHH
jgi:hypothetical protein